MFSYRPSDAQRSPDTSAGSFWAPGGVWGVAESSKRRPRARPAEQAEAALRALARDATYAAKVGRVRRHQARLRSQLSAGAWQAYLRLEEAELERWSYALERVARWAGSARRRGPAR